MRQQPGSAAVAVCLLVATVAWVAGVGAAAVTVESQTYGDSDAVSTPGRQLSIWQSDSHEFALRLQANETHEAAVCLSTNASAGPRELGCRNVSLSAGETRSVTVGVGTWPGNLTGDRLVSAAVTDRSTGAVLDEANMTLTVLGRDADLDSDGLTNEAEVEAGTDLRNNDTDDDTLSDALEVRVYGTSPTDRDSDADGLGDGLEIKTYRTDPLVADTDGDGLADGREVDLDTRPTLADTDGDGLEDGPELNTYQTDATAVDTDEDGLDDGAEVELGTNPTTADTDGDGLTDGEEVILYDTDPTRADTDGDGLTDRAEVSEHRTDPTLADTDGDGLDDGDEVEEHETDPLVADSDHDGQDDGLEAALGSDPLDPTSTADVGPIASLRLAVTERPLVAGFVVTAVVLVAVGLWALHVSGRLSAEPVRETLRGRGDSAPPSDGALDIDDRSSGDVNGAGDHDDGGAGAVAVDEATTAGPPESDTAAGRASGTEPAVDSEAALRDDAVLTNEERVTRLLDENGGRMLQSDMVEAADWSKATVSRVLTQMEEAGEVTRVDIGRGNLVARPGDEPANAGSPFSESDGP